MSSEKQAQDFHTIRHRDTAQDVFRTPNRLARSLIQKVPFKPGDVLCDAFAGENYRPFYDNYPENTIRYWMEKKVGSDAFRCTDTFDWIITNPPFSKLNNVMEYSTWACRKGFAYILPNHSLSYRRISMVERRGFQISRLVSFPNPKGWNIGFSHMFVIWTRNEAALLGGYEEHKVVQTILEDF